MPPEQVWGAMQTTPQSPQLFESFDTSTHAPLQLFVLFGQPQVPSVQT
jgi:hypothetical protein